MGACFISLGLAVASLGQAEVGETVSPTNEAIARAVSDLGGSKFSVRRRASQFLWEQGLAAEAALREAAASDDREVRIRAQRILDDFEYGILPGVPADTIGLIRQYRDGPANQRMAVLQRLADRDRFDAIQRLIRLEPNPDIRRQLLVSLMQNTKAVERFFDPDRLEILVASVGADRDETWRRTVLAQLLFSPKVIQNLAEKGRLDVLAKIVDREKSADVRRQMLSMLFQNSAAVTSLIENDQLQFVLQVITKEPEEKTRGAWISQLLAMSGVIQQLADDDRLEKLLQFAQDNVGAEQRSKILQQLFRSSSVLKTILEKRGIERLIALTAIEKDAAARGGILAALVTSMAVREHLTEAGQHELAINLARQEKDLVARSEYLKDILTSVIGYSLVRNQESRTALWALIKLDAGKLQEPVGDWRSVAILRILTMSSGSELLQDKAEAAWLMTFLRDDISPENRASIVERLVMDYRLRKALLEYEHFDALLALVKQLPAPQRGRVMGQLFASADPFGAKVDASRAELMMTLARQESDQAARRQYLQVLFQNMAVMDAAISGGFYDALWALIDAEEDPLEHAILRGEFLGTGSVVEAIAEKGQLDSQLVFAQEAKDPEVRGEFLKRLFASSQAMSALIEKGHYDALFALADDSEEESRIQLLCQFYGNTRVVEQLIAKERAGVLLDFAEEHAGDKRTVSYLQQLFFNPLAVEALVKQGRIETMLSLARETKDKYLRASLLRSLFGSPKVVQHFADNDQLGEMGGMINDEEAEVRYQIYYNMTLRSETLAIFVEKEWIDGLLRMLKTQVEAKRRGQLLGRVVVQAEVIEFLAEHKQLASIIQLAGELDDPTARQQYLSAVFSSVSVVGMLIDGGHFEALYRLASSDANPGQRTRLRAGLLTNSKAVEYLVAQKKVDLLLELVDEQTDQATRRSIVTRITYSPTAVAALIEHGKFGQLVELCRCVADADARRRVLSELLQSGRAVDQLASSGTLDEILTEVFQETDKAVRLQFFQRLFARTDAIEALVTHGYFDRLYEAAEAETDVVQRRLLFGYLMTNGETVQYLAAHGQIDVLMRAIADEPEPMRRRQYLTNVLYKPDAVRAILSSGHFGDLLDALLGMPDDAARRGLLISLLFNASTFEHLVDTDQLGRLTELFDQLHDPEYNRQLIRQLLHTDTGCRMLGAMKLGQRLLTLLQAEPEAKYREYNARRILSSEQLWQTLVNSDQADVIYQAAKWVPDEEFCRKSLLRMLYSPCGPVAHHLERGEIEAAERLLEQHADNDLGRLRLATYLQITGQIEERIGEVRERLESAVDPVAGSPEREADHRLLVYLLRAGGDLAGACETAEVLGEPGLLRCVCVEAGRWSRAAKLSATGLCPLPISSWHQPSEDAAQQRVEQLGIIAAYQRLAGDAGACDAALAEVEQLSSSHPTDDALQWLCIEALLLNGRVKAGLNLMAQTHAARAFELHGLRHEYDQALKLAGWNEGTQPDRVWLHSLPIDDNDAGRELLARIEFAVQVARTLHSLGKVDTAGRVVQLLDAYIGEQPDDDSQSNSMRRQCWERLTAVLLEMGDSQAAWEMAGRAMRSSDSTPGLLSRLYSRRTVEACGWWLFFREKHGVEQQASTLARVHQVLHPPPDEDAATWIAMVSQAIEVAQTSTDSRRESILLGVGQTCLRRGNFPLAIRCAASSTQEHDTTPLLLRANALRGSQRWDEAADAFHAVWRIDHSKLSALYLSGDALQRSGRQEDGQHRKDLAGLMALDSQARLSIALDLMQHGLREEADEQLRLLLRTAPFEHSERNEAARHLGNRLETSDPSRAIGLLEQSLLDDLRTWFYLLNDGDYLRTPAEIHRLRAAVAIDAGDFDVADSEVQLALTALPGGIQLAEQLVPKLEQAGRQQRADMLFEQVLQAYALPIEQYPESSLLNNDSAWLMARCGRRLDEALRRAEQAVRSAPSNASYLDTLAEVHFRLGDREAAVRHSRQAVSLRPDAETLRDQLHRFQNARLPESSEN